MKRFSALSATACVHILQDPANAKNRKVWGVNWSPNKKIKIYWFLPLLVTHFVLIMTKLQTKIITFSELEMRECLIQEITSFGLFLQMNDDYIITRFSESLHCTLTSKWNFTFELSKNFIKQSWPATDFGFFFGFASSVSSMRYDPNLNLSNIAFHAKCTKNCFEYRGSKWKCFVFSFDFFLLGQSTLFSNNFDEIKQLALPCLGKM